MRRYRRDYEVGPVPIYHLDDDRIILWRGVAFLLALIIIYGTFALVYYLLGG